jgi:hypothetical protein
MADDVMTGKVKTYPMEDVLAELKDLIGDVELDDY